jgi:hypothetical protein
MPEQEKQNIDPRILEAAKRVIAKRPKTVIDHIIKFGFITTEELKDTYGYDHPPRAARDVREEGIPLETYWVKGASNRKIGAYRFADPEKIAQHKHGGRRTFPKALKLKLLERDGSCCAICSEKYEDRYLTIDHKIPYEVIGDALTEELNADDFMLLCGTCQRKKSWSCEGCVNWTSTNDVKTCTACYWSSPENHSHLALKKIRRVELVWTGEETSDFDKIMTQAEQSKKTISDFLKELIRR